MRRARWAMARGGALAATCFALQLTCGAVAHAEAPGAGAEHEAAEAFRVGADEYARADYAAAAQSFERAYALAPHGSPAYNAALAWEAANEPARAADAYQLALDTPGLTSEQAAGAYSHLATLDKKLARVEIVGPAGTDVSVAHVDKARLPRRVHLAPGRHDLEVAFADGRHVTRVVDARAGSAERVDVSAEPLAPPSTSAAAPLPARGAAAAHPRGMRTRTLLGFGALGAGVLVAGVGTYLGIRALDARNAYDDSGHTSQSLHDEAASLRLWTNVAFVGAAVLAGTGVVLLLTGSKSSDGQAARASRIVVSPTSARLTVSF